MSSGIYLVQNDNQLVQMRESPYESEDLLQELLAKYPDLLAGEQMNSVEPRRWLLISREMGVDRWSIDHLFLDQDGIPTLVEVKRSSNTEIRRAVVGQMLDYAANSIVYWSVESLCTQFEKNCQSQKIDPAQKMGEFLGEDGEPGQFWEKVETNLKTGKIRMVFVADKIPVELQSIVEFLNVQMSPAEVLAVEIKQYLGQELRTLVPRLIGQTIARGGSSVLRETKRWDEDLFFTELEMSCSLDEIKTGRAILAWAQREVGKIKWGTGARSGTLIPKLHHNGKDHSIFRLWTVGVIETSYSQMNLSRTQEQFRGLGGNVTEYSANIHLSQLAEEARLTQFFDVCSQIIQDIRAM
ncbi:MAG: hypothetical protein KME42_03350 [Tildeniella nuda ZEHNDER 1965/U140]|jgi:hypothetical protein|nr:hypothetical protein [Tildeniella nuda ZEHNDER 1965/U140]